MPRPPHTKSPPHQHTQTHKTTNAPRPSRSRAPLCRTPGRAAPPPTKSRARTETRWRRSRGRRRTGRGLGFFGLAVWGVGEAGRGEEAGLAARRGEARRARVSEARNPEPRDVARHATRPTRQGHPPLTFPLHSPPTREGYVVAVEQEGLAEAAVHQAEHLALEPRKAHVPGARRGAAGGRGRGAVGCGRERGAPGARQWAPAVRGAARRGPDAASWGARRRRARAPHHPAARRPHFCRWCLGHGSAETS
jgi:hypothetical protein